MNYVARLLVVLLAAFFTSEEIVAQNCDLGFSLTGAEDFELFSITQSQQGDFLVVGSFKGSNVDFDPGPGTEFRDSPDFHNAFIASYNQQGLFNWVQSMGGEANLKYNDIGVSANGLIYICGYGSGTSIDLDPGASDTNHQLPENTTGMIVGCYSKFGTYRWGFIIPAEYNWELTSSIVPSSLELDEKGNIYVSGSFQTTYMDLDPGLGVQPYSTTISESIYNNDAFVVKYTQNGNYIWSTAIQSLEADNATSVAVDGKANAYLCGSFSGDNIDFSSGAGNATLNSKGETDIFLSKYDSNGNLIWAKNMGGSDADQANDLTLDTDTNIYITGIYKGQADMDPGEESTILTSRGNFDCFFSKLNKNGELNFAKSIGSDEQDNVSKIALNSRRDIFLTGTYKARADNDFDPGEGIKELTKNPLNWNNYLFASSYSSEGNLNWATSGVSREGIYGSALFLPNDETVIIGGRFFGSIGSIPTIGDNLYPISTKGQSGVFLAALSEHTGLFWAENRNDDLKVYPNPVSSVLHLKIDKASSYSFEYSAQLFSISGKLLFQDEGSLNQIENGLNQINPSLDRGSYFLKIRSGNKILSTGFIKK